jgi:hypothetical protein
LLEELLDYSGVHGLGFVHLARLGEDDFVGEFGDGLAHERLGLGEVGDGGWGYIGNVKSFPSRGGFGEASYSVTVSSSIRLWEL